MKIEICYLSSLAQSRSLGQWAPIKTAVNFWTIAEYTCVDKGSLYPWPWNWDPVHPFSWSPWFPLFTCTALLGYDLCYWEEAQLLLLFTDQRRGGSVCGTFHVCTSTCVLMCAYVSLCITLGEVVSSGGPSWRILGTQNEKASVHIILVPIQIVYRICPSGALGIAPVDFLVGERKFCEALFFSYPIFELYSFSPFYLFLFGGSMGHTHLSSGLSHVSVF